MQELHMKDNSMEFIGKVRRRLWTATKIVSGILIASTREYGRGRAVYESFSGTS